MSKNFCGYKIKRNRSGEIFLQFNLKIFIFRYSNHLSYCPLEAFEPPWQVARFNMHIFHRNIIFISGHHQTCMTQGKSIGERKKGHKSSRAITSSITFFSTFVVSFISFPQRKIRHFLVFGSKGCEGRAT